MQCQRQRSGGSMPFSRLARPSNEPQTIWIPKPLTKGEKEGECFDERTLPTPRSFITPFSPYFISASRLLAKSDMFALVFVFDKISVLYPKVSTRTLFKPRSSGNQYFGQQRFWSCPLHHVLMLAPPNPCTKIRSMAGVSSGVWSTERPSESSSASSPKDEAGPRM